MNRRYSSCPRKALGVGDTRSIGRQAFSRYHGHQRLRAAVSPREAREVVQGAATCLVGFHSALPSAEQMGTSGGRTEGGGGAGSAHGHACVRVAGDKPYRNR